MPEAESQTTPTESTPAKDTPTAQGITKEEVETLTKQAVAEALEATKGEQTKVVEEVKKETKSLQNRVDAAVTALQGGTATNSEQEFLEAFIKHPTAFFREAMQEAAKEAVTTVESKRAQDNEFETAIAEERIRHDKAGLSLNDKDWENIANHYSATDPNASTKDRVKEAVKRHHDFIESLGLGNFEARVKAAASVPSKSGDAPGGPKESSFDEEAELKKELGETASRYNRAMNIDD